MSTASKGLDVAAIIESIDIQNSQRQSKPMSAVTESLGFVHVLSGLDLEYMQLPASVSTIPMSCIVGAVMTISLVDSHPSR